MSTTPAAIQVAGEIMTEVNGLLDADSDFVWTYAEQYRRQGKTTVEAFQTALAMLRFQRARNFATIVDDVQMAVGHLAGAMAHLGGVHCTEADRQALEAAYGAILRLNAQAVVAAGIAQGGRPDAEVEG